MRGTSARVCAARARRTVSASRWRSAMTVAAMGWWGSWRLLRSLYGDASGSPVAFGLHLVQQRRFRGARGWDSVSGRATMQFKVLGALEVCRDGRAVALPGGKPRAVLAVLLLHANEPVERGAAGHGAMGPGRARRARPGRCRCMSRDYAARSATRTMLTTTSAGYRLCVASGELDADRFERLVEEGRRRSRMAKPVRRRAVARGARVVARSGAGRLGRAPFAAAEIARLEEQRLAAVEARIEADLARGPARGTGR